MLDAFRHEAWPQTLAEKLLAQADEDEAKEPIRR